MKRVLLICLLAAVGTMIACGLFTAYVVISPQLFPTAAVLPADAPPPTPDALPPLRPPVDVDALAARMKKHQDLYEKIRDEALATYAKRHPGQHAYDDLARMTVKLAAYLWVWDDYYGEGLNRDLDNYADHLSRGGCTDQLWESLHDIDYYSGRHSVTDDDASSVNHGADLLALTEYPPEFKFESYEMCVHNMVAARTDADLVFPLALKELPSMANKAVESYQALIGEHLPDDVLFDQGEKLLFAALADETTLKAVSTGLDHAFEAEDRQNSTTKLLDGEFYIDDAWNARGSGDANTMTAEGRLAFGERLALANQILSELYAKHPGNPLIANVMMAIVLGQKQPRDQMELWFQRGIQADPDNFRLYMEKRWYLLPRWYGSDREVWNFGLECSKSDNWSAKIPLILVEAVSDAASRDPRIYARPDIWGPVEKVYRAYLGHYPNSVHYRSLFAKCAVNGGHWDVAGEQFKILGDDWDRDVFNESEYAEMTKLAASNAK